jgi:hypothetical protein
MNIALGKRGSLSLSGMHELSISELLSKFTPVQISGKDVEPPRVS